MAQLKGIIHMANSNRGVINLECSKQYIKTVTQNN